MLIRPARCLVVAWLLAALFLPTIARPQADAPENAKNAAELSPSALADALEDEQTRKQLIEQLRQVAQEGETGAAAEEPAAASLPERLAAATRGTAEQVFREFGQAVDAFAAIADGPGPDWRAFAESALELGGLIAVTVLVFLGLRRLVRPLFERVGTWAAAGAASLALLRRTAGVVFAAALDGVNILLAWLAGWLVAMFVLGGTGTIEPLHSLFLNAFIAIEVLKALVRVVFSARHDALRLLPLGAEDAAYWYAWLAHLASFVGYGALVVVPVVNRELSPAIGQFVYMLVIALGFIYALSIILQNRRRVHDRLVELSHEAALPSARVAAAILARVWHLAAIAYLVGVAVALLRRSEEALPFMAAATLQSLLAIGVGVLLGAILGRTISRGIRVPEATAAKFPTLENRLNAFVPRGLQGIRLVIVVLVAALLLDAWDLFDLRAWLTSEAGLRVVTSLVTVLVILAIAAAAWIVMASWIDHWLSAETGDVPSARQRTLLALFRNALAVVIITMAAMITLSELGINIGPLIAGAGVLGLAIGFGAQKLVQDIIGGVFIQLENAINEGDWVTAGGISGTAERLSIRSVGLRDLEGTFHIVPFSSVDTVSNYMRDFAFHVGFYGVAYREDTDEVIKYLIAAFEELRQDAGASQYVIGDLNVDGVASLGDSAVNLRVRIKTVPGYQWVVGRAYNRLVKRHFDAAGIEIPFPHRTLYFGQDKDGSAPPANVRHIEGSAGGEEGDSPEGT